MYSPEEYDKFKIRVLKYVLYKKRTESEVRFKFSENAGKILDDIIEYLKEEKYIDDKRYTEKFANECIALKNLSIKELRYNLYRKGISKEIADEYITKNKEMLINYERESARKILEKRQSTEDLEYIKKHLFIKGYMEETIKNL
ncbi:MAG: RecX family transcriptional regulator [Lachnospiraceae bacterium]|jgi:regulatory protein|nr:RecX family transcriptional regulator [Lachnospiraceae bacterium]